ncbi:MAG: GNAT family N-acetyltransferase [Halobacteriales archaeon]
MSAPYLRRVDRGDITAVAALERTCFAEPWPPVAFAQFVEAEGFLVAIDPERRPPTGGPPDGALAGYVVTTPSSEAPTSVAHVRDIAVAPAYRRQGLASRLLERSLAVYAPRGLTRVRLEVRASNEPAIALYRKLGYCPTRRIPQYYADGETAIVMERALDSPG